VHTASGIVKPILLPAAIADEVELLTIYIYILAMHGRMNVKAVLLLKLEAQEFKYFYVCHEQWGCNWNCQRKYLNMSGYEPHEGLNVKT
jgi:hypothetical protein